MQSRASFRLLRDRTIKPKKTKLVSTANELRTIQPSSSPMFGPDIIKRYFSWDYHSPLMEKKLYRMRMKRIRSNAKEEKLETELCRPQQLQELFRINLILWRWDPFGVNHISTIDEYISFATDLFELKRMGAGRDAIVKKLCELDHDRSQSEYLKIAERILK